MEQENKIHCSGRCTKCGEQVHIVISLVATTDKLLKSGGNTARKIPREIIEEIRPLLGTDTDMNIAQKFHVSHSSVQKLRNAENIAVYKTVKRWEDVDPLFDTHDDDEIISKFPNLNKQSLYVRRRVLNKESSENIHRRRRAKILYKQGLTMEDIGKLLRVTRQRVEQLLKDIP